MPRASRVCTSLRRYAGRLLLGCLLLIGLGWVLQLTAMLALGGEGAWLGNALWALCWSGYLSLARRAVRDQRPRWLDVFAPLSRPLSHLMFGLLATSGASLFGFGVLLTAAPLSFVPLYLGDGAALGQAIRLSMRRTLARPGQTLLAALAFIAFNLLGSAGLLGGLLLTIPLSALALAHAHEFSDVQRPIERRTSRRSRGITLVETVLCITLLCLLVTSVATYSLAPLGEASVAAMRDRITNHADPQGRTGIRQPCSTPGDCAGSNGRMHQPSPPDLTPGLFGSVSSTFLDSASWMRELMRSAGRRVQAGVQALEDVVDEGGRRGREQTEGWVRKVADVPVLGSLARGYAWAQDQQRQFGAGALKGVVNIIGGSVQLIVDPISTAEGIAALLTSSEARAALVEGVVEPYEKAWAAGNYAEIPGRLMVDVGSIFYAGPKISSTLGQVARMRRLERAPEASAPHPTQQGPKCFGAGTPVLTPSGLQPIESIAVGDWVYARDDETGEVASKRVLATHATPDRALVEVSVNEGAERLRATPGHPFWVDGSGWTAAIDLAPGTPLSGLSADAAAHGSAGLRALAADGVVPLVGEHTVYNLTVEDFETYFVGELGVWVHNTGPGKSCDQKTDPAGTPEAPPKPLGMPPRPSDLSGGKHAFDRPFRDVVSEASSPVYRPGTPQHGRRLPIGRWSSREATQRAAAKVDPTLDRQVVPLEPGDGTVVHGGVQTYPRDLSRPPFLEVPADKALALPQGDGTVHIFPIDETHYLYDGPPGAR